MLCKQKVAQTVRFGLRMKKEPLHELMLISVWGKSLSIVPALCVWIPEGLDIVMRSASPIVSHLSQPYFHLYICKTISSFFTFFFKFANPYFLFFYFLCPTPNTYLQFRIYTKSRCDKKCPFPQFLISFIYALKSLYQSFYNMMTEVKLINYYLRLILANIVKC